MITGDLGFLILEPFPDYFLNIGVVEANMVTVVAGLDTMRLFERIRDDVSL